MSNIHFSSASDNWATPDSFMDRVKTQYKVDFDLDVCADAGNAKAERFYTREDDGLTQEWSGCVWCNPPYGRKQTAQWLKKAYDSAKQGATVYVLIPARTDTKAWHDYAMKGRIEFIKGRLKFGGSKNSAPFPSALIIFDPSVVNVTT